MTSHEKYAEKKKNLAPAMFLFAPVAHMLKAEDSMRLQNELFP